MTRVELGLLCIKYRMTRADNCTRYCFFRKRKQDVMQTLVPDPTIVEIQRRTTAIANSYLAALG